MSLLKNGAILDLNSVKGDKAVSFYNITNDSIIEKKDNGYVIESANGDIKLSNFIARISDNKYIVVGEDGDSPMAYLIYRGDIQAEAKNLDTNEDIKYATLSNMKSEEFKNNMSTAAKEYKCEVNTAAIEKYPCEMFITEPATEAATTPEITAE